MKRIFLFILLAVFPILSLIASDYDKNATEPELCDSDSIALLQPSWFVIKGEMSPSWNGSFRIAVTDPVKNNGHDIKTYADNKFQKTIPMRGHLQNIFLYVPGTMTIPVCAGDTIELKLGDDDLTLSSNNPAANLDLQLSNVLYRKIRKNEIERNKLVAKYRSKIHSGRSQGTDSLQQKLISKIADHQARYTTAIDTFIENHGKPRLEKHFRISQFYHLMRDLVLIDAPIERLKPTLFLDSIHSALPYNFYCDSFLANPNYCEFWLNYLMAQAYSMPEMKNAENDSLMLSFIRKFAPTTMISDLACFNYWSNIYHFKGPETANAFVENLFETSLTPEIKAEYAQLSHDITRLCSGESAPGITLTDGNGHRYTLDDFKGKYLYLDFWDFGCKPCLNEFAVVPELKEHFGDKMDAVEIVTVCASKPSKSKLEEFARQHGMTERNLILDKKRSDKCYDMKLFPTYVLIDPDGKIVEFNTARPSSILKDAKSGIATTFEKALNTPIAK